MQTVLPGETALLKIEFRKNDVLYDPVSLEDVDIIDPNDIVVESITPTRESEGVYYVEYEVAEDAEFGIWKHEWIYTPMSYGDDGDQVYQFEVGDAIQGNNHYIFPRLAEAGE